MQAEGRTHGAAVYPLVGYSVQELYETILSMEPESFRFLLEDARRNQEAVRRDLEDPELPLGRLLKQRISGQMTGPLAVSAEAQAYTAAAGEARMSGLNVTIMAIAGSGNHGITNFVGVLSAAEALGASEEQTATALAISSMLTIYIKAHIKRMTAFCGCGVAAATGMTAAVSYLLGGSYDTAVHAMQTVLGTIGGMFCDGAKISCAYKLSTAASLAVQAAYLAREGCFVPAGVGIIGNTIEQTFANVGRLNDPGMVATDRELCGHHCGESTTYGPAAVKRPDRKGSKIMIVLKGRVLDGNGGAPIEKGAVVLEDNRIRLVCQQSQLPDDPTAEVYELEDGTIMPGLIDAHVHMGWGSATAVDWISMTPQLSMPVRCGIWRSCASRATRRSGIWARRAPDAAAVAEGLLVSPVFSAPAHHLADRRPRRRVSEALAGGQPAGIQPRLHRQRCG